MKQLSVAIDGPAGVGKGVTSKLVAERLNLKSLDSGAIYRAIALYFLENNISYEDFDFDILDNIRISFNDDNEVVLNGVCVEDKIRTPQIGIEASNVSKIPQIRELSTGIQRDLVLGGGYIVDGRATAFEIPEIPIKIFLTASVEARARRKIKDFTGSGDVITYEKLLEQMKFRDNQDASRDIFPLKRADDAILVDNTNLTIEEQVEKILEIIRECTQKRGQ